MTEERENKPCDHYLPDGGCRLFIGDITCDSTSNFKACLGYIEKEKTDE